MHEQKTLFRMLTFWNNMRNKMIIALPVVLIMGSVLFLPLGTSKDINMEFELDFPINDTIKVLYPEEKNINETILITNLLSRYHYSKLGLSDSLSSVIFDNYLQTLDANKQYFFKSDIESFEKYRYLIDDNLMEGDLSTAYQIFAVFKERLYTRMAQAKMLLDMEFDYSKDESYVYDRGESTWISSNEEMDELWRKSIKSQFLNLKLSGKDHEKAKAILEKRYKRYSTSIQQYKSSDVYQSFMNSFTESFDPHTSYFNPRASDNFDIEMSKSLEGIGARLGKDGDYTIVHSIVPGGPAFKGNLLHDNDKIVGVGQGEDGEIVDVVGWRNDDVVQLIRGKKGTTVRLNILKAEDGLTGPAKVIKIVREKINLEDAKAESSIYEFNQDGKNFKLGIITLPDFYKNFKDASTGNKDYVSATRDVKKIITDLKTKNIDGLMIDLRRNGGGALDEAIELTGLFINHGPVVQVKDYHGKIDSGADESGNVFYDGPLAVLTSRFSASASEIFSAAIQDYRRGIIIGEQSFGKGTVQNLIGLQRYIPDEKERLGHLKLTVAKYYRITGGSTQNIGVTPDLEIPSVFGTSEFGESSYPSALPWDQIPSSKYDVTDEISDRMIADLKARFSSRKDSDLELKKLLHDTMEARENRNKTKISLNEVVRKAELENEKADETQEQVADSNIAVDTSIDTETPSDSKQVKFNLKDIYLKQGLKVLADMVAYGDV